MCCLVGLHLTEWESVLRDAVQTAVPGSNHCSAKKFPPRSISASKTI